MLAVKVKTVMHSLFSRKRKRYYVSRSDLKQSIYKMLLLFLLVGIAHVIAIYYAEKTSLGDAIWLTFTTVTTVGYGDVSAQTFWGRVFTVILLYFGGIFIFSRIISDYVDLRIYRKEKQAKGLWRWNMSDHILIVEVPQNGDQEYLPRLINRLRETPVFADKPIQILTTHFEELPEEIQKMDVVHTTGSPRNTEDLKKATAEKASHIIVLAKDEHNAECDAQTFDTLHRIKEIGTEATIVVECVQDSDRQRLQNAGANVVLRPIRAYPGMLVRSMESPGSENIMEDLFSSQGSIIVRYEMNQQSPVNWMKLKEFTWEKNIGVLLGYADHSNTQRMVLSDNEGELIVPKALFVMRGGTADMSKKKVESLLKEFN